MPVNVSGAAAIVGLGMTEMTRQYIGDSATLALRAIRLALDDAGLGKDDLDGLLVNSGMSGMMTGSYDSSTPGLSLQTQGGFRNLRLMNHMSAAGSTAAQMVHYATLAIASGMANVVACVFADAPLTPGQSAGSAYGGAGRAARGVNGLGSAYGFFGANTSYALAARRHMSLYGTTNDQLGAIAVSNRQWATRNPRAMQRQPITLEDYHNSRWVVEPFHLLDCTLVTNGGIAVIVTSAERARDLKQPPAYVLGMGQGHPGNPRRAGYENEVNTGAVLAGQTAFRMAGVGVDDVDLCEIYDCYTYTTLVTLEDGRRRLLRQ
jgi:acetyl-CoA acetyltransferase